MDLCIDGDAVMDELNGHIQRLESVLSATSSHSVYPSTSSDSVSSNTSSKKRRRAPDSKATNQELDGSSPLGPSSRKRARTESDRGTLSSFISCLFPSDLYLQI